jgi:nucleoid DNA-binding protein
MLAFLFRDSHVPAIGNFDAKGTEPRREISRKVGVSAVPRTGAKLAISPRRVIVFKPSAILKHRINDQPWWRCVTSCDGPKMIE